jgi:hypothetical protein
MKNKNKSGASNNLTCPKELHPYFITGFCEGEACFSLEMTKNSNYKTG